MIFIHTLRMIAELSVYFYFAELFVISSGGVSQLIPMLLLSLSYGILVFLQKKRFQSIYMLLPILILLYPGSSILTLLPPIIYILYSIWKERTMLSWDRQSELFSLSLKLFLIAGACISLSGNFANYVQYSLPMAFLSLTTSIFLMRMLRHDPSTYLSPQYQRKNCFIFMLILILAWLFSRDFVFAFIGNMISFVYMKGIYPILTFLITCFVAFLNVMMKIFSWLKLGEVKFEENLLPEGEMGPTNEIFHDTGGAHIGSAETLLTILAIAMFLTAAFFFFRWLLLHKGEESFISQGLDMIRGTDPFHNKKERATTTVLQVRRQYRIFLKLYREHGGKLETSSTSEDILNQSLQVLSKDSSELLKEMREIYTNARYRGSATKTDLKRMKQINKELTH